MVIYGYFSSSRQFTMNFRDNSKNECRKKYSFRYSFYSAHSASFTRIWPLLKGGICISLHGKKRNILKFSLNREGKTGRTTNIGHKEHVRNVSKIYQIQNQNREIDGTLDIYLWNHMNSHEIIIWFHGKSSYTILYEIINQFIKSYEINHWSDWK